MKRISSILLFYLFSLSIIYGQTLILSLPKDKKDYIDPENVKEWKLIWADEFSYKSKDSLLSNWNAQNGPTPNTSSSRWVENIELADGTVRLVNKKESRGGQDWTSGSISTKKKFLYGYYECRYKYAASTSTNNSFWLLMLANALEGKKFEIDINEGKYPDIVRTNVQNWSDITLKSTGEKTNPQNVKTFRYDDDSFSFDHHLFGLEWTAKDLIFYVDRREIRRIKNTYCYSPAYIYLSLAVMSGGKPISDDVDLTYMEVDYIRFYNRR